MTSQIGHWIDGRPTPGTSGRTAAVFNPATGEHTGDVALASSDEVSAAVAAAVAAARSWRSASLSRRAAVLFAFRELLHAHADELAALVTAEHGKVLADAAGEVARGLENVEFATGVPQLLKGGYSEQAATGVDVYSIRQPLGCGRRDHPVQLPGHGAAVDVRQRDRLRQRVRAQAVARRTRRRRCGWPSCGSRPGCPTACSPSCRATRRRSTRC